jgi:acetyl-CoA synthetase
MAYVILYEATNDPELLIQEIRTLISNTIGPIAKPDRVLIVSGLPKTRSGKIMRRILRKLASNETDQLGDVSTLLNPDIVDEIKRELTI